MRGVVGVFLLLFAVFFSFTFVAGSEFVVDFYVDEPSDVVVEDSFSENFIWDQLGCFLLILFVLIVIYFIFKKNKVARRVSEKKGESLVKIKKKRKVSKKKGRASAGIKKKR